jgi:hypothetical protein
MPFSEAANTAFARFEAGFQPQGWLRICIERATTFLFGSQRQRFRLQLPELLSDDEETRDDAVGNLLFTEAFHNCMCGRVTLCAITPPTILFSAHLLLAPEAYDLKSFDRPLALSFLEFLQACAKCVDSSELKRRWFRQSRTALVEVLPVLREVGQIRTDDEFQTAWKPLFETVSRFSDEDSLRKMR